MKTRFLSLLVVFAALLTACGPRKYAPYTSIDKDYAASVPWGWNVLTDGDGKDFAETEFIGPFDPQFFLGAPALRVRWYRNYRPHRLPDGRLEIYASADDFISQMLKEVYRGDQILYGAGRDRDDPSKPEIIQAPQTITLQDSGFPAKYFVVLSPTLAPASFHYGIERDRAGRPFNLRQHAYAVVPVGNGFYVLCYPATRGGYARYEDRFRALLGTFQPLTEGPHGPPARFSAPRS